MFFLAKELGYRVEEIYEMDNSLVAYWIAFLKGESDGRAKHNDRHRR